MLRAGAVVLLSLGLSACSSHAAPSPDAAKARSVAAGVFAADLEELGSTPGVQVVSLPGGTRGCPERCPTTYVAVSAAAAKGSLAFDALLGRLQAQGWMLGSTQSTAGSCTEGTQSLPCSFQKGTGDGVVVVTPGDDGSYRVSTAAEGP